MRLLAFALQSSSCGRGLSKDDGNGNDNTRKQ